MIILPDRNQPRGKLLIPQRPIDWRAPSQRKAVYGIEDQTRFRLTASLDDGHVVWRGWFDDREDADAFLLAAISGSLGYERELWDLPTPAWRPDIGEGLFYDFATVTFLTASPGSNQTYTTPQDWNNANNSVQAHGGGGGGGKQSSARGGATSGGGSAWAKGTNIVLGSSATYQLGLAGVGGTSLAGAQDGTAGGDTWFNGATFGASSVGAKAGTGGKGDNVVTFGTGGLASACIGGAAGGTLNPGATYSKNGGDAGAYSSLAGSGGGAGGPNGVGAAGGTTANLSTPGGGGNGGGSTGGAGGAVAGGAGGNNSGGTGGGAAGANALAAGSNGTAGGGGGGAGDRGTGNGDGGAGGNGGAGTEHDSTHGSGGGGATGGANFGTGSGGKGGNGGAYGGGGAAGGDGRTGGAPTNSSQGLGGDGGAALLVLTYTPRSQTIFRQPIKFYRMKF